MDPQDIYVVRNINFSSKKWLILFFFVLVSTNLFSQVTINYSDFESGGWGLMWQSTGANSSIIGGTGGGFNTTAGKIELEGKSGTSRAITKQINLTNYSDITITYDYRPNNSFSDGSRSSFRFEFSNDDFATSQTIIEYVPGTDFTAGTVYTNESFTFSDGDPGITFSPTSKFRILSRPHATDNPGAKLFIDNIHIEGTQIVSGLNTDFELWLKADAGVFDAGGNLPDNDEDVEDWEDQETSNSTTHATVGAGATGNWAEYVTNGINFNPAINFKNGDNGYFDVNLDNINYTDFNIIAIVKRFNPNVDNFLLGTDNTANNYEGLTFGYSANNEAELSIVGSSSRSTVSNYNNPEESVALLRGETIFSATKTIYELRDATSIETVEVKNNALQGNHQGFVGKGNDTEGFRGYISEILTYSAGLTDVELQKIYSYLAIKYGMTLDDTDFTGGDYVSSEGSIIWDASTNSTYHNNVTGIGRDDATVSEFELDQKQSTSQNAESVDIIIGLGEISSTNANNGNSFDSDKEFLIWGNNAADYTATPLALTTLNFSSGITPSLTTDLDFSQINRVWKFVETGTIESTKVSIPESMFSAITPSVSGGIYYMIVSDDDTFNEDDEYVKLSNDSPNYSTNYEADFNFTGTQYVTFGYAPYTIESRSAFFDGDDYIDMGDVLDLNSTEFTVSAWVKVDAGHLTKIRSIVSKRDNTYDDGFDVRINEDGQFRMSWKIAGSTQFLKTTTVIPENEWHHVAAIYGSGTLSLYIDGVLDISDTKTAPAVLGTDYSLLIGAADESAPINFFRGNIDELRIWDVALSVDQLHYIMNQEIEANGIFVGGKIIPNTITKNDISTVTWGDLAGYYPMSTFAYPNVLIDDSNYENNGRLLRDDGGNNINIDAQTAPLPYISKVSSNWGARTTWNTDSYQTFPGNVSIVAETYDRNGDGNTDADDRLTVDWNIVVVDTDIPNISAQITNLADANSKQLKMLGLIVRDSEVLSVPGITNSDGTGTGIGIEVSAYLYLGGTIDLQGESQLIQSENCVLVTSANGYLERDQQGTSNSFNYNYWSSFVGPLRQDGLFDQINEPYKIGDVLFNGNDPDNPVAPTFNSSAYAADSGSGVISSYWLYQFYGESGDYNSWFPKISENSDLAPGVGYTMKGSLGSTPLNDNFQNYALRGKPYNGDITVELLKTHISPSGDVDRLIGNPYPSAIDADLFIQDNLNTSLTITDDEGNNITGTNSVNVFNGALYYWDHFGQIDSHILKEYVGGYGTYTLMGGVGAIANDDRIDTSSGLTSTKIPGQYIPVGQAFFVRTALDLDSDDDELEGTAPDGTTVDGGNIIFKNSHRIFQTESYPTGGSVFMRSGKENTATNADINYNTHTHPKIRLLYNSPKGYHRQLLIGANENTTNSFDIGYDGLIADIGIEDLFWIVQDAKFVIQGVPNFNKDQEFPLGLIVAEKGIAEIKLDKLENIDESIDLYIKDRYTGETVQINDSPFEINLEAGEYFDRFSLVFQPRLQSLDEVPLDKGINTYVNNTLNELVVRKIIDTEVKGITIYNFLGQQIITRANQSEDRSIYIQLPNLAYGVYLVHINTEDGTIVKKVVVE